jgi:hypothetical protein
MIGFFQKPIFKVLQLLTNDVPHYSKEEADVQNYENKVNNF